MNIDYPEYDDVEEMTSKLLVEKAKDVKGQVEALLETAGQGKILREGLATAIIGRPNVGKSSLLNVLLKEEEKAIVTEVAGTTRDVDRRVCERQRSTFAIDRYSWYSRNRRYC